MVFIEYLSAIVVCDFLWSRGCQGVVQLSCLGRQGKAFYLGIQLYLIRGGGGGESYL